MSREEPEAWSPESADLLREATEDLVGVLQRFSREVERMHGGTAEIVDLVRMRAEVLEAASSWDERVGQRSGYLVFPTDDFDAEAYGEVEDVDLPDDVHDERSPAQAEVSVISRFDLAVVDAQALMVQARQAWRDEQPSEDERDAAVAMGDVAAAVGFLLDLRAPAPYERFQVLPGVEIRAGMHLLVDPDGPLVGPDGEHPVQDLDHPERAVAVPPGTIRGPSGWGC